MSPSDAESSGWCARLKMVLDNEDGTTRLRHVAHEGPLRLQRPFYPEGNGVCHLYLLHPPGGMVSGDALNVCATLEKGAHALVTTPSAGKIYRGDHSARPQHQRVTLQVAGDSRVEWLPQETIVFDGARGELETCVDLQGNARVLLWDVVCLGRPASGEAFRSGYLAQKLLLSRNGKRLYRERNLFAGGSAMLQEPWGMGAYSVGGTCLATCELTEAQLMQLREDLQDLALDGVLALSQVGECLLARYRGNSAQACRQGFEAVREKVRPLMGGPAACGAAARPRIWNT